MHLGLYRTQGLTNNDGQQITLPKLLVENSKLKQKIDSKNKIIENKRKTILNLRKDVKKFKAIVSRSDLGLRNEIPSGLNVRGK